MKQYKLPLTVNKGRRKRVTPNLFNRHAVNHYQNYSVKNHIKRTTMISLIITKKHLQNLLLIFCSTLLITIFCEKKCISAGENSLSLNEVDGGNVVVEVNGIKFTQNELDTRINPQLQAIRGKLPEDHVEHLKLTLRDMLIDNFIKRTLLNQEIEKHNIVASESEIKQAMNEIEATIPKGTTFETWLKQGGISIEEYRENITFSVRINKLFESQVKNDYTPSEEEIKKYYIDNKKRFYAPETVHARHILIKLDKNDDEKSKGEKKAKIEALRKQLLEGADFEKLAKESSECPSKEKGGDLGTFSRKRMVKPFSDAAFSQKVNEIGPIVQTELGYHIIQVLEHNQAKQETLYEVKDKIREDLIQRKKGIAIGNYIDELKKKAKIVYHTTEAKKK